MVKSLSDLSPRMISAVIVLALFVVVAGTWLTVRLATNYLIYQDATSSAESWATVVVDNVPDIEQIASGEMPLSSSMEFFDWARKTETVFRYVIYNTAGYSQLVSEREVNPVGIAEFSSEAVRALKTNAPVVDVREGTSPNRPAFYGRAFVPVFIDDQPVAIISAFVDETAFRATVIGVLSAAGIFLSLLTALSFGLPAIAWYRRTREKQIADRRIRYLAHHDGLTGLINRPRLIELLNNAIISRTAEGRGLAVHFVDLDKFKEVNDTLGHDGGDFLLKSVAERLRLASRPEDLVARLGGDEFIVIQDGVTRKDDALPFAERLASALASPLLYDDHEIMSTVSIGVALAPANGTTSERLLKCADLALYASKSQGRNCIRFFQPEMDAELQKRLAMETLVRNATRNKTFQLHYQPIYGMADRRLLGFEALVRLPAEDGTLLMPHVFIPVAEDLRLIDSIGAWILNEACTTAVNWPEHLTIAVNLSPSQFEAGSFSEVVKNALQQSGLKPQRLELEITEKLILDNDDNVSEELRKLDEMGVSIVMDDFGTGYSSLSYLWKLPFKKIKIDQSFMEVFERSPSDAKTVIRTILNLGRQLDMQVTVEGVETANQVRFLDGADAEQVQGYYFSRPLPAADLAACIIDDTQRATKTQPLKPLQKDPKQA